MITLDGEAHRSKSRDGLALCFPGAPGQLRPETLAAGLVAGENPRRGRGDARAFKGRTNLANLGEGAGGKEDQGLVDFS